jgi:CYTH domain-containing protein
VQDAEELLQTLCDRPWIDKIRYRIPAGDLIWEVDEFLGENAGLVLAEVELTAADQVVDLPAWIGEEVTGDPKYYNSSLVRLPYSQWGQSARPISTTAASPAVQSEPNADPEFFGQQL